MEMEIVYKQVLWLYSFEMPVYKHVIHLELHWKVEPALEIDTSEP